MNKIEPVENNLTDLLNNIGVHPKRFVSLIFPITMICRNNITFSSEHEQKNIREAWEENNGLPKPRPLWNQQPHVDSTILNRFSPMSDSSGKK